MIWRPFEQSDIWQEAGVDSFKRVLAIAVQVLCSPSPACCQLPQEEVWAHKPAAAQEEDQVDHSRLFAISHRKLGGEIGPVDMCVCVYGGGVFSIDDFVWRRSRTSFIGVAISSIFICIVI